MSNPSRSTSTRNPLNPETPPDSQPEPQPVPGQVGLTETQRVTVLVAIAVVCLALVAGLYIAAVRTHVGQRADEAAIIGRTTDRVVQRATTHVLNTISVTSLILAGIALGLLALSRRRPRLAIGVGVMVIAANITTQLLKTELLTRPDLLQRPHAASTPSFPSGHATVAMSLALGFVLVVPPRLRVLAGSIGITYAVLIGAGTLTGGWHRPSDVIAAYLITTTWTVLLAAWIITWRGTGPTQRPWRHMMLNRLLSSPRLIFAGAGLLTAALLVTTVVLLIANGRDLTTIELGPSYLGAVAAITGTALVILGVILWALRGALLDPPPTHT